MGADASDPIAYKAEQIDRWNAVARGWARWWPTFEQGGQRLSDRLVTLAQIGSGDVVLDVATGIGEPAMTAVHEVQPDGHVVGVDQAPRMLEIAQARARDRGLPDLHFVVKDAENLGFEGTFDAALSRWGLMLVPDPGAVLHGLHRALKPGARVAASVWGPATEVPVIQLVRNAIQDVLGPTDAPVQPAGPFHLADPDRLQELASDAGFRDVDTERLTIELEWPSPDAFLAFHDDVSPPMIALSTESVPRQKAVRARLRESVRPYADPDGRIRIPNETLSVVGRAP